jgi:hypothetical protein
MMSLDQGWDRLRFYGSWFAVHSCISSRGIGLMRPVLK